MNINEYTLELESIFDKIKKNGYNRIALQLPEGLKSAALNIADVIHQETTAQTFILADPCYGACDTPAYSLQSLGIDLIIHIGHTPLRNQPPSTIPILFLPAKNTLDPTAIIKKVCPHLTGKNIGILTTAPHHHMIPKIRQILLDHGFNPVIGTPPTRASQPGEVLGCNYSAATSIAKDIDHFLYYGSGYFHPLGVQLATKKPVVIADPYLQKIDNKHLESLKDSILRQRYGAISLAKQSKRFGIILSIKPGQQRIDTAYTVQQLLKKQKKSVYLLILDRISPELLVNFRNIDCYVSTGCPRVAIDDYQQYKTPILTPIEIEILVGVRDWKDYQFDELYDENTTAE